MSKQPDSQTTPRRWRDTFRSLVFWRAFFNAMGMKYDN